MDTIVQQIKRNTNSKTFSLMAGVILVTAVNFVFQNIYYIESINNIYYISSGIIALCMLLYVLFFGNTIVKNISKLLFTLGMLLISMLSVFAGSLLWDVPIWTLGCVLISGLIDKNFGIMSALFFALQTLPIMNNELFGALFSIIITTLVCFLIDKVNNIKSMLYLMVTVAAVSLALSLIFNGLVLKDADSLLSSRIIICYIADIAIEYIIYMLFLKVFANEAEPAAPYETQDMESSLSYLQSVATDTKDSDQFSIEETMYATSDTIPVTTSDSTTETAAETQNTKELVVKNTKDYSNYCDLDSEVLTQFKAEKKAAFVQARKTAVFASECAERLELNESFTEALALHFKVGKLMEGDVAQNTFEILSMFDIDADIIEGCSQLNGYEGAVISSKEAGVVSLSDTVVASYSIFKAKKLPIASTKLVDTAVGKLSVNGKISESQLTLGDLATIRNYFVEKIDSLENN